MIGSSEAMPRIFDLIRMVAPSRATILVSGENGTGKELVARAAHFLSERRNVPFIKINCAATPEHLVESELFGYEKGAFTGAIRQHRGKFELAHGGTLLLDEISEMALLLQAKLLRVLQEREIERLGGRSPIPVDARIVATTNRRLQNEVKEGRFREDLYYRLKVVPVHLPPLRDRRSDRALRTTGCAQRNWQRNMRQRAAHPCRDQSRFRHRRSGPDTRSDFRSASVSARGILYRGS
ncbi:MAG: sigma-54 factor interaction domain-containing protein [candidate division Zixibacteria bacterium]|nr:sigma-54 factor interaction domain-containing protein [candidate division Zixibacteria bacterium]